MAKLTGFHAKHGILFLVLFTLLLVVGCGKSEPAKPPAAPEKILKIGVTAGPHAQILEIVKKIAEKDRLNIQIVEFNDYIQPNLALNQGDIDLNSFQHLPYLETIVKDRKYDIVSIGKSFLFPMGIYSKTIKNTSEVKNGSTVAIPIDPINGGRALAILEKGGLLKLKAGMGHKATVLDIAQNPKNLKIKELDAAQIPRSLEDVELVAINANCAITAGLVPIKDALILEDSNSPYANIIAARGKDKDNPLYNQFLKAYQSEEVKKFISEQYKGLVLPAF